MSRAQRPNRLQQRHNGIGRDISSAFRPARWLGLFGVGLAIFRLVRRRRAALAAALKHPIEIDDDITHGGPRLARPCSDAEWFDDRQVRP